MDRTKLLVLVEKVWAALLKVLKALLRLDLTLLVKLVVEVDGKDPVPLVTDMGLQLKHGDNALVVTDLVLTGAEKELVLVVKVLLGLLLLMTGTLYCPVG